ncbi:DUF6265 family protein [Algoriphagus sp.]|uniref:DUF6265 family protein n=1 Tax=Algoriphagus sp. TaxID=1872435 RepID=UPI002622E2F5|nr:DUF6265 family protein [Algoriphagus sp.]
MRPVLLFLVLFMTAYTCLGQELNTSESQPTPGKGNIEDLHWLVGYWSGQGLGGECEEVWMPARDGHMIGTFRFWNEGKLIFSEYMHLLQEGESITMKIKHFNPDLRGWEEKENWTTFSLIELGNKKAWFDGLTLERKGDKLVIWVDLKEKGEPKLEKFTYRKKVLK